MLFSSHRWQTLFVFGLVLVMGVSSVAAQPPADEPEPPEAEAAESNPPMVDPPPESAPPVMNHNEELTTDAESDRMFSELRRMGNYKVAFKNAKLNNSAKEMVQLWAKWRFYQLTLKSKRQRLHEIRDELMQEIAYAGQSGDEKFRYFFCEEVTTRATELLTNNFYVRLNAAIVLARLNVTDDRRAGIQEAYVKAAIPLMDVLNAKTGGGVDEQLEAVKIQAAIGLGRINLLGKGGDLNISVEDKVTGRTENLRNVMAKTLIRELKNPDAHEWYQKRLIDGLASIDLVNDLGTGKPIIVEQLGEVLADKERHPRVRARAAHGLGRCPLPGSINTDKLVFQILMLEYEMATAYQKSPNEYYWLDSFRDVYLAFHPESNDEIALFGNKRPPGLTRKQQLGTLVGDAFDQIVPITKHIVEQPGWIVPKDGGDIPKNAKIPDQMISDLAKWLQDHQPASHKLTPNLPDLAPSSPIPTASTGSPRSG